MSKTTLYIASSIDGFIATKDHGVDWLSVVEDGEEDYGYNEFYKNIDAVVMGSKTYDFILNHGEWPYNGKKSFIFTSKHLKSDNDEIEFLSMNPTIEIYRINTSGYKNIWLIGGGLLNTEFLNNELIDEIILSIIPIVLGEGIPLFPKAEQRKLNLVSSKSYSTGVIQTIYNTKQLGRIYE